MSRTLKTTLVILAISAIALAFWSRQRSAQPPAAVIEPDPPATEMASAVAPKAQAPDSSAETLALKGRLADEMRARHRAEAEAAALRDKVAPMQSNVVVSLGKVEDVGKSAGTFLPAMAELTALSARDPSTLNPDEKRRLLELQRDHAKLLGALPEITKFQDNPDDYGRFFKSMLQQAASLTDPQAAQVEAYMRQRAIEMNQQGLNAGREPTDPKLEEAWEEQRDQFNARTAEGLKGILPPGAAEKAGLSKELMEFLEMDFDKIVPQSVAARAE
jgi:hypothetical protein